MVAAVALVVAACGGDGATVTSSGSTLPATMPATTAPAGTAPATTAPATTGAVPTTPLSTAPEPSSVCPEGELPAAGAVDLATGEVQWTTCSAVEAYRTLAGTADGAVVLGELLADGGATMLLSVADGTERWRQPTPGQPIEEPRGSITAGGIVISWVSDGQGSFDLAGFDATTGDTEWQLDQRLAVLGQTADVVVVAPYDPMIDGPSVVRGIDRATGTEVWSSGIELSDLSGVVVYRGPAAVWDSTIAIPTGDSLTAVDIASGAVRWVGPRADHPVAAEGVIVGTIDSGRTIRAIDGFSGELLWEAPGRASYGELLAIGDGIVVVNSFDGPELVAYNLRDGSERWRVNAAGLGEPQLIVGSTVVTLWEGVLGALSTANGSAMWTVTEPFGSRWMSGVGVDGTTLVVSINSVPYAD